jgi:O-antigen ligase
LESSWGLIGYTPHNLYLETLLSSGVFGLLPLILMVMVWLNLVFKIKQLWAMSFAMVGISLYFLMRTQIGVAIGSSYDFFTAMMIAIFCLSTNRKLQFQSRNLTEEG